MKDTERIEELENKVKFLLRCLDDQMKLNDKLISLGEDLVSVIQTITKS